MQSPWEQSPRVSVRLYKGSQDVSVEWVNEQTDLDLKHYLKLPNPSQRTHVIETISDKNSSFQIIEWTEEKGGKKVWSIRKLLKSSKTKVGKAWIQTKNQNDNFKKYISKNTHFAYLQCRKRVKKVALHIFNSFIPA